VTTTFASELLLGAAVTFNGKYISGTGYSVTLSQAFFGSESLTVSALGTYDAKFSSTANNESIAAAVVALVSSSQPSGKSQGHAERVPSAA